MSLPLPLLLVLVLAGLWCLVSGEAGSRAAALGLVFGTVFVTTTRAGYGQAVPLAELPRRGLYLVVYLGILIPYDLARSNVRLARRLLRRRPDIRPGIVRVPIGDLAGAVEALEEHAITMAPGQMIVDYSDDRRTIYVHLIDATEVAALESGLWRTYRKVLQGAFS